MQPNLDHGDFVAKRKELHLRQPFILATGTMEDPIQYFIVIDKMLIEVGTNFTDALDILVSSFFAFNVHYPDIIKRFLTSIHFFFRYVPIIPMVLVNGAGGTGWMPKRPNFKYHTDTTVHFVVNVIVTDRMNIV